MAGAAHPDPFTEPSPARQDGPEPGRVDYHYFGPPCPGRSISPYWPTPGAAGRLGGNAGESTNARPPGNLPLTPPTPVPWNPAEAHRTIAELLGGLAHAVAQGPYRALPTRLLCACPEPFCLLPALDRYCEINRIPRTNARPPATIPPADVQYILLTPRLIEGETASRVLAAAGTQGVYAALYAYQSHANPDAALRALWKVADLDTLAAAVATEGSGLWTRLIEALSRTI